MNNGEPEGKIPPLSPSDSSLSSNDSRAFSAGSLQSVAHSFMSIHQERRGSKSGASESGLASYQAKLSLWSLLGMLKIEEHSDWL